MDLLLGLLLAGVVCGKPEAGSPDPHRLPGTGFTALGEKRGGRTPGRCFLFPCSDKRAAVIDSVTCHLQIPFFILVIIIFYVNEDKHTSPTITLQDPILGFLFQAFGLSLLERALPR